MRVCGGDSTRELVCCGWVGGLVCVCEGWGRGVLEDFLLGSVCEGWEVETVNWELQNI